MGFVSKFQFSCRTEGHPLRRRIRRSIAPKSIRSRRRTLSARWRLFFRRTQQPRRLIRDHRETWWRRGQGPNAPSGSGNDGGTGAGDFGDAGHRAEIDAYRAQMLAPPSVLETLLVTFPAMVALILIVCAFVVLG